MAVHPLPVLRSPARDLVRRALRWRRRGEARRALVAFREACAHEQHCARTWTLYAVLCAELGRLDSAREAFRHAMWLRKQAHQTRRVAVLEGLISRYGLDRQCA